TDKNYPPSLIESLSQMLTAVAMFADNLKFKGAVTLQSKGDGALIRSLAECRDQSFLRGIMHLAEDHQIPQNPNDITSWLGQGYLALTLIPEPQSQLAPYQGLVELKQQSLAENLENYFANSEQLQTRLFFATQATTTTGLLLQRLPDASHATEMDIDAAQDAWHTLTTLAQTLREEELLEFSPQELLQRLFAQFPCRLHTPRALSYQCTCSRHTSDQTLRILGRKDLQALLQEQMQEQSSCEQGHITVDCEFCGTRYRYDAVDIAALHSTSPPPQSGTVH
ncbi:MAG: hypothetical protein GXP16_12790, partial [Gammaproteobacteria bacterium]|nr:hypothetical protein [Gammaproteobacteria bacterium]